MATYSSQLRQGLPRVAGGDPWPAAGEAPIEAPVAQAAAVTKEAAPAAATTENVAAVSAVQEASSAAAPAAAVSAVQDPAVQVSAAGKATEQVATEVQIRQGLPRVAGGEPWPAAGTKTVIKNVATQAAATPAAATLAATPATPSAATDAPAPAAATTADAAEPVKPGSTPAATVSAAADPALAGDVSGAPIRRGLPRVSGGEAWPAAGVAPAWAQKQAADLAAPAAQAETAQPTQPVQAAAETQEKVAVQDEAIAKSVVTEAKTETQPKAPATEAAPAAKVEEAKPEPAKPAPAQPAAKPTPKPAPAKPAPKPREPIMIGEKTLGSCIKIVVLGGLGAIVAAAILVLAARGVTTLPGVPAFMQKYPGEYNPSVPADPGFPAWARWTHFLNIFLMVLIIRSGMHVRTQQRPPAFWTPKNGGKKISINLWLHTSLDILWVVNGIIFVTLLFVTGHWSRIVPTSWEVFPNAASAMLQYMTLDWPTENGWVNYNSLQQLMYFIIVFVAAPLAIITGVRMSEWWPEKAATLNKIYPAPLARAIHFPTMLFFVLFILVHVFLVITTGALRNLNHMFAGQDVVNWTGFWLFALAIAVTVGGWFATKPLILAPIASLFGRVSNR